MVRRSKQQRTININVLHPPVATAGSATLVQDASIDFDLRTLASDADTPLADLHYALGSTTNGSVTLLGDGYTARFTPTAGFTGSASFGFTLHDTTPDSRTLLNYTFQNSDVTDSSGQGRNATVNVQGTGAATFAASSPLADYTKCLALTEKQHRRSRAARPRQSRRTQPTSADWTLAGWFKRNAATNMDVIAHLGNSGGFGNTGSSSLGFGYFSNNSTLQLRHWDSSAVEDITIDKTSVTPPHGIILRLSAAAPRSRCMWMARWPAATPHSSQFRHNGAREMGRRELHHLSRTLVQRLPRRPRHL